MKDKSIIEEGVEIPFYGEKISKELNVFYNPEMKFNRDISLMVIDAYFDKKISFCDPMAASGIREIRFLKKIPEMFSEIVMGDISLKAIKNAKNNFKKNNISCENVKFLAHNANKTIFEDYFDFIEVDPFGSPIPFLDAACQRIKHRGILSVTATDTAALCGTYPKTAKRKYGVNVRDCWWYEELGLRNLIAYSIRQAAKYEKVLTPLISYSYKHYYKIFFKVEESRTKALESVNLLSYLNIDEKTQDVEVSKEETNFGKTYVGVINDKSFLQSLDLSLIEDKKEAEKFISKLIAEIDIVGHYNPHKLQKSFNIKHEKKFDYLISRLRENGFEVSRAHNNRFGIKTNAKCKDIVKIINE